MSRDKADVLFAIDIYRAIFDDLTIRYGYKKEFLRDFQTVKDRTESEGFSFISKTLPLIAAELDKALSGKSFSMVSNFKKKKGHAVPAFLWVLQKEIYTVTGTVKPTIDPQVVKDIRQVCLMFKKYERPYDEKLISDFLQDFKEVDAALGAKHPDTLGNISMRVLDRASCLIADVVSSDDLDFDNILPKHGPGSVATMEKPWEKMHFKRKYKCIHEAYPYYKYFVANSRDLQDRLSWYKSLEPLDEGTAKVILVPKDSKGPRLISAEPLEFMWIQQGLARLLMDHIESHPFTRGHINFTSQEVNRSLVKDNSPQSISTLDMSKASDRISVWLVENLFKHTDLLKKLMSTRTSQTLLPTGDIMRMNKFAPMGSALCFPIMSLVHWGLAVSALIEDGVPINKAYKSVYVFGDDIILHDVNPEPLFNFFRRYKLRFNEEKSCWKGGFRESCGCDAYEQYDVTPIKIRRGAVHRGTKPEDVIKTRLTLIELSNHCYERGLFSTSEEAARHARRLADGPIPYVSSRSPVPGFKRPGENIHRLNDEIGIACRYNNDLQVLEYRCQSVIPTLVSRRRKTQSSFVDFDGRTKMTTRQIAPSVEYLRTLVGTDGSTIRQDRRLSEHRSDSSASISNTQAGIYAVPHSIKNKWGWNNLAVG